MLLSFALAGSVTRRFWAKNAGHGPAESLKNRILSSIELKAGFSIEGMVLDERFGAQVGLVYLFHEDRRQGFARAFSLETYHAGDHVQFR